MSDLLEFVSRINGFRVKSFTDKVEIFGWYLHENGGKPKFGPTDLLRCFEAVHESKPSNIHSIVHRLSTERPARMLKDGQGYRLSAAVREQVGRLVGRKTNTAVNSLLTGLLSSVTNKDQQTFLDETIACYNGNAHRAAIVMGWNLAYSHLCDRIFDAHLTAFNANRTKVHPKLPEIIKRTDFQEYGERQVIDVCRTASIVDKSIYKILQERLDRRNTAAHPSAVVFTSAQAEDLITDLVNNVLLNSRL
ncbi:hypothetical protein [Burkholderia sp. Ac-20353]|uniref:hypothetical protein n=1 Tax=Burkholderia sp. Ac-20353 TaxID=2703894 RepID=UPI00197C5E10|nr:hypothetical protein [Burkholderia sp. Ac-20353]MBN3791801.1 hypothetical protein [Burkholderia sp. Ac-20353]